MRIRPIVFVAVALGLAACGGAPSESQVRTALVKMYAPLLGVAEAEKMMGSAELLGCSKAESDGYLCKVKAEVPVVGTREIPMRLVKIGGDWTVIDQGQ